MVIDPRQMNTFVLDKHHLLHRARGMDIPAVADDIVALHATGPTTPYLSLFCRIEGFRREHLDREMYERRALAKVRCMRKTVHVLTRGTFPVAIRATQDLFADRLDGFEMHGGMRRETYERVADEVMRRIPEDGWTTRESKQNVDADVNLSWVLNLMCDQGLLLRWRAPTGWRSNAHRYVPLAAHFPEVDLEAIDAEVARATLVERYITAFGPVTVRDAAWWTGLKMTEARRIVDGLEEAATHLEVDGLEGEHVVMTFQVDSLSSIRPGRRRAANLVPPQDPYMVGYKDRGRYLDPERTYQVFDRAGNPTSTILVDGVVAGVWDMEVGAEPVVKVHYFDRPSKTVRGAVEREARRLGSFVTDAEVSVEERDSMVPLDQRTMGSFMHPLKDAEGERG